ncbi:MAG: glycosyltransferase [Planctomycetaceae bacterium]
MSRLRVGHVVHQLGVTGSERGIEALVRHASPDIEHIVFCQLRSTDVPMGELESIVRVVYLDKPKGNSIRHFRRVLRALREARLDVVNTQNWGGMDAICASRLARVPAIVHGEIGWQADDPHGLSPRRNRVRRWLSRWVHEYTCVSEDLARWLRETVRVPRRVTPILNGLDCERYAPGPDGAGIRASLGIPQHAFVVGSVGRLSSIKDYPTLIQAIERVELGDRPVRLLMVGTGEDEESLRAKANGRTRFLGLRLDVPELLRAMDVFAMPSLNEGTSFAILEAMATGLPVVASRAGGNPELVLDGVTGTLFPVSEVGALVTALTRYGAEPARARAHGAAARTRTVERLSLHGMVEAYEQLWRRVASETAPRRRAAPRPRESGVRAPGTAKE